MSLLIAWARDKKKDKGNILKDVQRDEFLVKKHV